MTSPSRHTQLHCPDCGRPVEPGADLCACGFPLMFLRQDEPAEAVLKPSRRPGDEDDDTDELPVTAAPAAPLTPSTVSSAPLAGPVDGVVCTSCDEVNPPSRTWCAQCGAALRERRDPTAVLPAVPAPRARRTGLLVGGAAAVVLALAAGGVAAWVLSNDGNTSGRTPARPLKITGATASKTAGASEDNLHKRTTYEAVNVTDGNPATAWRTDGQGVDVTLVLPLGGEHTVTEVALIPGFAKTDPVRERGQTSDRFQENGRVTEVRWEFDDGVTVHQGIPNPTRDWTRKTLDKPAKTTTVRLVIKASEAGTRKGRTTAISEVQVIGR